MSSTRQRSLALNLKDIAKRRIIEQMVRNVSRVSREERSKRADGSAQDGNKTYCVMLVDVASLRILSSCCKVYDLLEDGVTVVEDVTKQRQPLPELDAIYFLSPDLSSVELLCRDFQNPEHPQYRTAHVFFTLPLGHDSVLMDTIAACPGLLQRLRTFVEFNLGFVAYERRVFHFDSPGLLFRLFPPSQRELINGMVNELFSLCVTLGDKPNIRFHSNSFRFNEQLAALLHQKLSRCEIPGLTRGRTNLIIVDRSIDLAPLLLHEFTYQVYIYDLLDVPVCLTRGSSYPDTAHRSLSDAIGTSERPNDTLEYTMTTNEGKQETRIALLSDQDDVYVRYRHQHLMVALKQIPEEIKRFLNENAAAKLQQKKDMTNEEMQKAIRDLPEFQEMLAKFSIHHSITQRCFTEFNRKSLHKIAPLEQDLSSGVDANGKPVVPKKCLANLGNLMADPAVGTNEKLRLLLLYFTMMDGVREEEKQKMIEAAQLPLESSQCIANFMTLGLDKDASTEVRSGPSGGASHCHRLQYNPERLDFFMRRAKTVEVALSRFQPYLKSVMEEAVQGCLHRGKFQYVTEPDTTPNRTESEAAVRVPMTAVRARNKNWEFTNLEEQSQDAEQNLGHLSLGASFPPPSMGVPKPSVPILIIFVLGGVTFSETRAAYEVSRQLGCEIFIGGSSLLTPPQFLKGLKQHETSLGLTRN